MQHESQPKRVCLPGGVPPSARAQALIDRDQPVAGSTRYLPGGVPMLPPPLSPLSRIRNGWYDRREDIPAPPADKPYLKHGGKVSLRTDHIWPYFTVHAKRVTLSGGRIYILAFSAHRTWELSHPPYRLVQHKIFAATTMTVEQREQKCRAWLVGDTNDTAACSEGSAEVQSAISPV